MLVSCNILHKLPLPLTRVIENDTLKLLCSLKESKSTGPDKINVKLVKDSAEVICATLTKIFNSSLQQVIFPEDLKNATISPVYKNGDKSDCAITDQFQFYRMLQKFWKKLFIIN